MQMKYDFAEFENIIPKLGNLSYDKSCIFSKELIWHRSFQQELAGNRSKIGFYSLL